MKHANDLHINQTNNCQSKSQENENIYVILNTAKF